MLPALLTVLSIALGFALDCLLGDPAWLPHPVRWIGRLICGLERLLRRISPPRQAENAPPESFSSSSPPGFLPPSPPGSCGDAGCYIPLPSRRYRPFSVTRSWQSNP